jgi:hypothetical protein
MATVKFQPCYYSFISSNVVIFRFYDLQQKHGDLDPLVNVDLAPNDPFVKITFGEKVKTVKLNLKQTVGDLKESLTEFCGLPVSRIKLVYMKPGAFYYDDELVNPKKLLYSLLVEDGDSFVIHDKGENPYAHQTRYRYRPANVKKTFD